ncbi:MAG: hypothetical protein N2167_08710 [Flavobacteriales bacterium]|nr:hypothetical protein [Flavobacteriales bacterium]
MKNAANLFLMLIVFIFFASCSKDENTLDGIINSLSDRPQKYTVNSDSLIVITTPQNSKIIFQPASFKDAQGNTVNGEVDVFVKELFKKGDFIRNQRLTNSISLILKSGGAIMVKVFQNEREVFLDKPAQILLPGITGEPDSTMEVFYWKPVESDSLLNENPWLADGTWTLASSENTVDIVSNTYNTPGVNYYYSMVINELNWINCDAFLDICYQFFELNIQSDLPLNYYKSRVFIVFNSINSVISIFPQFDNGSYTYTEYIPSCFEFRVFAIYKDDQSELQYALTENISITGNYTVNLEFQQTTPAELALIIDNL